MAISQRVDMDETRRGCVWMKACRAAFIAWGAIVLWQCIATWYWWPRARLQIENTAALSGDDAAWLPYFITCAIEIPFILHLLVIMVGVCTAAAKSMPKHSRVCGIGLIICGIGGAVMVGYTVLRYIVDLA